MFEIKRGSAPPAESTLEDRLLHWQTVFRVRDWRMQIRYFDVGEDGADIAHGSIHYWLNERKATVKVERGLSPEREDAVICHEVAHILLLGIPVPDELEHVIEQALDVLVTIITGTELNEEYPS